MLAHSFFMGSATVFFETAASALFLARFGAEVLPWVYLVAAGINTITGVAYTGVRRRLSFDALMTGTVLFLLLSVCAFRFGLGLTSASWLVFGGLVWYRVISILTDLEYWAVATRLYDVRQAKRLFGLIGTGEVVARIAGSFSVPLLVPRIGVENLVLVSAASLLACFAFLVAVQRQQPGERSVRASEDRKAAAKSGLRAFVDLCRSPYTGLIFLVAATAVLGKYFVDFAFLEQMKSRYQDAPRLAGFFGLFSGVSQALSLLIRLFLSGRLLGRFGIRVGLLVLPVAHVACTLLILFSGFAPSPAAWIFWLAVANQGIYKTLKHPIDNPSFKVLYQPLRLEDRLSAQIAVEAIVGPLAMGLAGLVMLLFAGVIPYEPILFAGAMLLTFGAWLAGTLLVRGEYQAALIQALEKRIVDGASFVLDDAPSLAVVRDRLQSHDPGDVIFALDLLEKAGDPAHAGSLLVLLDHASPEVRRYVLLRVEALRPPLALHAVDRRLDAEDSPWVRSAAMRALCSLGGAAAIDRVVPFLDHADPQIRRGALVGLLRAGGPEGRATGGARLLRLAESRKAQERELAAQVMAEAGDAVPVEAVLRLLEDPSRAVRRAALLTAGRLGAPSAWPALLSALADPALQGAAGTALVAAGVAVLPDLRSAFEGEASRVVRCRIASVLGRIGGAAAAELLWEKADTEDETVRSQVLEALVRSGFRAGGERTASVQERVMAEARGTASKLALLLDVGDEVALVRDALRDEVHGGRDRVLLLLSLVYDAKSMLSARENLSHALRERRAYALEILDVTLPRWLRASLMPLFDEIGPEARLAQLEVHFPQPRRGCLGALRDILSRPEGSIRPWTRACALFACATAGIEANVDPGALDGDPLVREAAGMFLAGKRGTPEEGTGMKTIEKVILLKRVEMFARTPEEVLAEIAQLLEEMELKAGQAVFQKGDVGDGLYIVVDGSVRVFDGERTLRQLGPRDIFGELALLDPEPRSASVQALQDTRLLRLDRDTFSELMAGNIEMVTGVLRVLCQRLRRLGAATPAADGSGG